MKQKILLFSTFAAMLSLAISSYNAGPGHTLGASGGNRTGGPGSSGATCATGGCHGATSNATSVAIQLKDMGTGQVVSDGKYKPLRSYEVTLTVTNSSFSSFGFQAEVVNSAGNNIGVLSAQTGNHTVTIGGRTLVEHHSRISGTTTKFTWISPQAGSGTATFHAIGNAVNGNITAADDVPSQPFSAAFTENNTSVDDLAHEISVKAYPNPLHGDVLTVQLENAMSGSYTLNAFDLSGKHMVQQQLQLTATGAKTDVTINTSTWRAGMYHVQIAKGENKYTIPIIKY